jgi:hypothetical protein
MRTHTSGEGIPGTSPGMTDVSRHGRYFKNIVMLGLDPSIPAMKVSAEPVMPCACIPLARGFPGQVRE